MANRFMSSQETTPTRQRTLTQAASPRTGAKTCCSLASGMLAVTREANWHPAAGSRRPTRPAKPGRSSASGTETRTTWTSAPRANCSPTTPTWSGTWARRGTGRPESATSLQEANSAGEAARANGQPTTSTVSRRLWTSARDHRSASASGPGPIFRRSISEPSTAATGPSARCTPCI